MGGSSRERGLAPVSSKPWDAAGGGSGDGPVAREARDGRRAEALPACGSAHHEEAEAHEGQVGRLDINRVLATPTNFHRDEDPVDDKGTAPGHPRLRSVCLRTLPPRSGVRASRGNNVMRVSRGRRVLGDR